MIDIERLHRVIENEDRTRGAGTSYANALLSLQCIVDGYDGDPSKYIIVVKEKQMINQVYDDLIRVANELFNAEEHLRLDIYRGYRGAIVSTDDGRCLGTIISVCQSQLERLQGMTLNGAFIDNSVELTIRNKAVLYYLTFNHKQ